MAEPTCAQCGQPINDHPGIDVHLHVECLDDLRRHLAEAQKMIKEFQDWTADFVYKASIGKLP